MAKSETDTSQDLSFEAALAELEKIVKQLESGSGDLKNSIAAYERGVALKKLCEERLREAESRIEKITLGSDGTVGGAPFSPGEG